MANLNDPEIVLIGSEDEDDIIMDESVEENNIK